MISIFNSPISSLLTNVFYFGPLNCMHTACTSVAKESSMRIALAAVSND